MNLQNIISNNHKRFLKQKISQKIFLLFNFIFFILIFQGAKAETNNLQTLDRDQISTKYLDSRNELEDYILDTGDAVLINFFPASELDGVFSIDEEGELFLPRIDRTYVRGLTTSELKILLQERFSEFLIQPDIKLRIVKFKSARVLINGEVRNPGIYKFPPYKSSSFVLPENINTPGLELSVEGNENLVMNKNNNSNIKTSKDFIIKRSNENIITISDVIRKSGGITSSSDLSKIRIIRDIPLGKGGGKKSALVNFNSFLYEQDPTNDIRIFDGDNLFIPKLTKKEPGQIPKSILSGLSPKFISVNIYGRVETPGAVDVPLESTLSDALDLTGPIKPLSGKVVLIRYKKNGQVIKKDISYSSRAKRGSKRNPYLVENDYIAVKDSFLGKTTGIISEITAPFVGIYTTKEIFEGLTD